LIDVKNESELGKTSYGATQKKLGRCTCCWPVKAKIHYAIQLANQLASWFA